MGTPEDPATGSAAAIFASQLAATRDLGTGETAFTIYQGVEMGRPSRIGVRIASEDGAVKAVHISGMAVPISEGRIAIPAS